LKFSQKVRYKPVREPAFFVSGDGLFTYFANAIQHQALFIDFIFGNFNFWNAETAEAFDMTTNVALKMYVIMMMVVIAAFIRA
jgi:hypothetical protein